MRLSAIERPRNLFVRLYYTLTKRRFGKVFTPAKVMYARVPGMAIISAILYAVDNTIKMEPELKLLIKHYVSFLNGCTFCMDMAEKMAIQQHLSLGKFYNLSSYRHDPLFTHQERAALAYVEEATHHKHVPDEVFATLQRYFTDREIVEITFMCAAENYFNLTAAPLDIGSDGLCAIQV